MDFTSLKETADALQLKAGLSTPANQTEAGWWLQIALAAEGIAGASTSANPTTIGYMLRAARALETAYGGNGLQENASYEGFLERIADALELNTGLLTGGNLARRIRVSALALSDTALRQLNLTNLTIPENTTAGTLVGTLTGIRAGSTFALLDSAGTRFALSGTNINTGAVLTNFETATSHNIIVQETNAGFTGSPKSSTITINVSNVFEAASLNALTLSDATYVTGTAESGTITGLTSGSTLSVSGSLPTGFTVDTTARTWAWSGSGSASTPSITLIETLGDSANSPRSSTIALTISAPVAGTITAPTLAFAAARPAGSQINFGAGGNANITIDATVTSGMYWNVEVASNSGFTTPLSGEVAIRTETLQIVAQDFITGPAFTSLLALPAGLTYIRIYVTDDSGRTSAMSNSLTDTLTSPAAKLTTTDGVNKNSFVLVSNGDLQVTGANDGGSGGGVRVTQQPGADKTQFEIKILSFHAGGHVDHAVYIEDGTLSLGPTTVGVPTAGASVVRVTMNKTFGYGFTGGSSGGDVFFGDAAAVNDVITLSIDKTTDTVKCYLTRGGTTTLQGTKTVTLDNYFTTFHPIVTAAFLFNFGASAFTKTPEAGFVGWNG